MQITAFMLVIHFIIDVLDSSPSTKKKILTITAYWVSLNCFPWELSLSGNDCIEHGLKDFQNNSLCTSKDNNKLTS